MADSTEQPARRPARGKGARITGLVVHIDPGPTPAQRAILEDPCLNGRHFPAYAYLTRGGTAKVCRRCGVRL